MKLSIVICTYNRERLLPYCLDGILNQSTHEDVEYVFVDNNSTDGSTELMKRFVEDNQDLLACSYHLEPKQGLSHARNKGIEESSGDYIGFIDDDAIMPSEFIFKTLQFCDDNKVFDAFGGKILVHFEGEPPIWENKYVNSMFGYFEPSDEPFIFTKSDYPRGSNMFFRKELFENIGVFNPKLGRVLKNLGGNEEKDLFQRIYKAGLKVKYTPQIEIEHIAPIERTEIDFVRRQANGVGLSERTRVKSIGLAAMANRVMMEIIKWGGTFVLSFLFAIKFQFAKAIILVRFRFWISCGLLGIKLS